MQEQTEEGQMDKPLHSRFPDKPAPICLTAAEQFLTM